MSPFHAVSGLTGASNWGVSRASRPTTPAPATAFPGSDRLGFGPAGAGGSSSVGSKGVELERVLVETRLLIAADGPMSLIRKQLAGDGPPQFDVSGLLHIHRRMGHFNSGVLLWVWRWLLMWQLPVQQATLVSRAASVI